jgi:beta-1,4-mannosyl-glycoprotein beta-1,4-N-acetylglucosaminyltransferase
MNLHEIGLGYGTDKATYHNFLNFYESKIGHLKNEKIKLLEIGFLNGNSIKTWLDYFPNGEIYCIDIVDIDFTHERFHFIKISQDDKNLVELYDNEFFDIIIDDGSHMTSHQFKSLEYLWSKLKYSGIYIIEDLHTSFRSEYIDTLITPYQFLIGESTVDYLKEIKKEMKDIEIFKKDLNDDTDSLTSLFFKEIQTPKSQPKVIDCFIFYNELDMLEFRLEELDSVVDNFVIVESSKTFVGKDKPLFFKENITRFEKYLHKITHIVELNMDDPNPWVNETTQRNAIDIAIKSLNLEDDDIILISDVDEIPDTKTIQEFKTNGNLTKLHTLRQEMYYYNLTCKFDGIWHFAKAINYLTYKIYGTPQVIRNCSGDVVYNGGWHFSYFGDAEFIKNKINNFSHQEYNSDEFTNQEHIETVIKNGKDLFKREGDNITYTIVNPDENPYLPKNYKKLLKFNIYN